MLPQRIAEPEVFRKTPRAPITKKEKEIAKEKAMNERRTRPTPYMRMTTQPRGGRRHRRYNPRNPPSPPPYPDNFDDFYDNYYDDTPYDNYEMANVSQYYDEYLP